MKTINKIAILLLLCSSFIASEIHANVNDTMDSLLGPQDSLNQSQVKNTTSRNRSFLRITSYKFYGMTMAAASGNETCDEILEEEGLSPNDVVYQVENPSGEIVDMKAEEACKVCIVGNGSPEWKCTPYEPIAPDPTDPTDPPPITPELPTDPGECDGLSDALEEDCGDPIPITPELPTNPTDPTDPTDPTPITPELPTDPTDPTDPAPGSPTIPQNPIAPVTPEIIVEVAEDVDNNTNLNFPNLTRDRAINIIQTLFLPRNVDAQPRAFSSYGISVMRAANNAECPSNEREYNVWGSLLHSRDGEGDEDNLIWNSYDSESTGIATGLCLQHGEDNRWGFMLHYGQTDIEHDIPGEYESDNYGAGLFYIFQNQHTRINTSAIYSFHDGKDRRDFYNITSSYGDRDSTALHFGVAIEGLDANKDDQELIPFANLLFSYVAQEAYDEKGFPLFTLDFEKRQTWWLNAEAGIKWIKRFLTEAENTWGFESAAAMTFLDNISDEDQLFTYYWNRTLGISSKDETEFGGALRFGLFWKPKDPDAWRVSVSFDVGYLSEQVNHSSILTFTLPFGE